jgi:hypothetical protein
LRFQVIQSLKRGIERVVICTDFQFKRSLKGGKIGLNGYFRTKRLIISIATAYSY